MTRPLGVGPAAAFGRFPHVGRADAVGRLLDAARRPPAVVPVEGEAGIGKSRLVAEASAVLGAEGRTVLTGFCQPLRAPFPYGPLADAVQKAAPRLGDLLLPSAAGPLARLSPALADRLPTGTAASGHGLPGCPEVLSAVRVLIGAIGPTVLVVEDLHWVDDATRDLLLLLARDLPDGLSLVVTYRAEALPSGRFPLGTAYRHPPGASGAAIRLGPLTAADLRKLATAALGHAATPSLVAALNERSQGLPLVAEEDLAMLAEALPAVPSPAASASADPSGAAPLLRAAPVPRGLHDTVTACFAALSPSAAAVLEAAAVFDAPAEESLLAAVAGLDPEAVGHGLTEAVGTALLHETDGHRYAFRHALARQVVLRQVPLPRRLRLHRRAIEALEQQDPAPLARIAHHTLALGDHRTWLRRADEAAAQAAASGDRAGAAALLYAVLAQPAADPSGPERAALALAGIGADGLHCAVDPALLRAAVALPGLSASVRGELRLALGLALLDQAADRAGFEELARAVEELADRPERAARAALALATDGTAPPDRTRARLARAERAVDEGSPDAVRAAVRATRLGLLCDDGDPSVWPLLDLLPHEGADVEVLRQSARALHRAAVGAVDLGHDRRAAGLLAESDRLARLTDSPVLTVLGRTLRLRLDLQAGCWDGLEERLDAIAADAPDLALADIERSLVLGLLAAARGRPGHAAHHYTRAAARAADGFSPTPVLRAAVGLASVRLARGAPHEAMAAVEPAVALLRLTAAWPRSGGLVPVAVEAASACGDRDFAERLAQDAESGLRDRDAPAATAELQLARGLLLLDAEPRSAAALFDTARRSWQTLGRPLDAARAAERTGTASARADGPGAAGAFADAVEAYARLGAHGDLTRCRRLAHDLGVSRAPSPGRRGYGPRLSPREQQVAELLAVRSSNRAIATALRLSPRTVENHVASVLRKLRTSRKSVAAAMDAAAPAD